MAPHYSILVRIISLTEKPGGLQPTGPQIYTHARTHLKATLKKLLSSQCNSRKKYNPGILPGR